jgi:hypothetical protein
LKISEAVSKVRKFTTEGVFFLTFDNIIGQEKMNISAAVVKQMTWNEHLKQII